MPDYDFSDDEVTVRVPGADHYEPPQPPEGRTRMTRTDRNHVLNHSMSSAFDNGFCCNISSCDCLQSNTHIACNQLNTHFARNDILYDYTESNSQFAESAQDVTEQVTTKVMKEQAATNMLGLSHEEYRIFNSEEEQATTNMLSSDHKEYHAFISDEVIEDMLKVFEVDDTQELLTAAEAQPRVIRVALDSGAGDHVASPDDMEGFLVEESPGSKASKHFIAANGERIRNQGQVQAQMHHAGLGTTFGSTFQVANVSRPLYSVSKMCDTGATVTINAQKALVHKHGKLLAQFDRHGGLYLAEFTVKPRAPATPFAGQVVPQ
jgi:hypothetical protein